MSKASGDHDDARDSQFEEQCAVMQEARHQGSRRAELFTTTRLVEQALAVPLQSTVETRSARPVAEAFEATPSTAQLKFRSSSSAPEVGSRSEGSMVQRMWHSAIALVPLHRRSADRQEPYQEGQEEPSGINKLLRMVRIGRVRRTQDTDEDGIDIDQLDVPIQKLTGASRQSSQMSVTQATDSSANIWIVDVWKETKKVMQTSMISDKLRATPWIVRAQAFFKLSYDQFRSDDLQLDDNTVEGRGSISGAATSQGPGATAPKAAAGKGLKRLGSQRLAAIGASDDADEGLVVDLHMKPTLGNVVSLLFWSPMHPNSMSKMIWDVLYLPVNVWICLVTPVLVVFVVDLQLRTHLGRTEFAIDILCCLDLLTNLRTAVITRNFTVRTAHSRIAAYYFQPWGVLDLVACVPFLTVIQAPDVDSATRVLLFRLLRLAKLLRIPYVIKSSNVRTWLLNKLFMYKALLSLLTLLVSMLLIIHHCACYFYFIGVVATENTMVIEPPVPDPENEGAFLPQTWVDQDAANLEPRDYVARYIFALYWAMYTFLTVGYGNIGIYNVAEKIWAIITAVIGMVMVGWFMAAVGAFLGGTDSTEAKLQQQQQDVFQFISKRHLSAAVAKRVQTYTDAVMPRELHESDLQVIKGLPPMLRTEVVLYVYRGIVSRIDFMQTRPPQFVVDLLLLLQLRIYVCGNRGGSKDVQEWKKDGYEGASKEEHVARQGEIGTRMYFLTDGVLEIRRAIDQTAALANAPTPHGSVAASSRPSTRRGRTLSAITKSTVRLRSLFGRGRGPGSPGTSTPVQAPEPTPVPKPVTAVKQVPQRTDALACILGGLEDRGPAHRQLAHYKLGTVEVGEFFGYQSCSGGEVRRNSVVAVTRSEVLVLEKKDLQALQEKWPDIFREPKLRERRRSACMRDDCVPPPSARGDPWPQLWTPSGHRPSGGFTGPASRATSVPYPVSTGRSGAPTPSKSGGQGPPSPAPWFQAAPGAEPTEQPASERPRKGSEPLGPVPEQRAMSLQDFETARDAVPADGSPGLASRQGVDGQHAQQPAQRAMSVQERGPSGLRQGSGTEGMQRRFGQLLERIAGRLRIEAKDAQRGPAAATAAAATTQEPQGKAGCPVSGEGGTDGPGVTPGSPSVQQTDAKLGLVPQTVDAAAVPCAAAAILPVMAEEPERSPRVELELQ